jgi:hypothetical protein
MAIAASAAEGIIIPVFFEWFSFPRTFFVHFSFHNIIPPKLYLPVLLRCPDRRYL